MNILLVNYLISLLIIIPTIIGLVRYSIIDTAYHPFVWICVAITLSETLRFVLLSQGIGNYISYNLFLLVNTLLYIWLFNRWDAFAYNKKWLQVLLIVMPAIWLADHFLLKGYQLPIRTVYFRICYSLLLVLLSINIINRLIVTEKKSLLKNARFLICMSLVIYYTYRIIIDAFSLKIVGMSSLSMLANFNRYLLIGLDLIFALAALWIPRKKNYTIQF